MAKDDKGLPEASVFEDDTEFSSKSVKDGALICAPKTINKLCRGSIIRDDNAVKYDKLMKKIAAVMDDDYVMIVPQLSILPGKQISNEWILAQCGMGPNLKGGVMSMCACRHEKRSQKLAIEKAREGKLWWAIVSSTQTFRDAFKKDYGVTLDFVPRYLVALHKVQTIVNTQKEFYEVMANFGTANEKSNAEHRLGDLFIPSENAQKEAQSKFIDDASLEFWGNAENYLPTHPSNRHLIESIYKDPAKITKDLWWSKGSRAKTDEPMFHIGYHTSHPKREETAFTWADPEIQYFDHRYGNNGMAIHGYGVEMGHFKKCISKCIAFSHFANVSEKVKAGQWSQIPPFLKQEYCSTHTNIKELSSRESNAAEAIPLERVLAPNTRTNVILTRIK